MSIINKTTLSQHDICVEPEQTVLPEEVTYEVSPQPDRSATVFNVSALWSRAAIIDSDPSFFWMLAAAGISTANISEDDADKLVQIGNRELAEGRLDKAARAYLRAVDTYWKLLLQRSEVSDSRVAFVKELLIWDQKNLENGIPSIASAAEEEALNVFDDSSYELDIWGKKLLPTLERAGRVLSESGEHQKAADLYGRFAKRIGQVGPLPGRDELLTRQAEMLRLTGNEQALASVSGELEDEKVEPTIPPIPPELTWALKYSHKEPLPETFASARLKQGMDASAVSASEKIADIVAEQLQEASRSDDEIARVVNEIEVSGRGVRPALHLMKDMNGLQGGDLLVEQGNMELAEDRFVEAAGLYSTAAKSFLENGNETGSVMAHRDAGDALTLAEDHIAAAGAYRSGLEVAGDNIGYISRADMSFKLGLALEYQGERDEAVEAFKNAAGLYSAAKINGERFRKYDFGQLEQALDLSGQYEKAITLLEESANLSRESIAGRCIYGNLETKSAIQTLARRVLDESGSGRIEQGDSFRRLARVLKTQPDDLKRELEERRGPVYEKLSDVLERSDGRTFKTLCGLASRNSIKDGPRGRDKDILRDKGK